MISHLLIEAYGKGLSRELAADYASLPRETVNRWFRIVDDPSQFEATDIPDIMETVRRCNKARADFVALSLEYATPNQRVSFVVGMDKAEQEADREGKEGTASERVAALLETLRAEPN